MRKCVSTEYVSTAYIPDCGGFLMDGGSASVLTKGPKLKTAEKVTVKRLSNRSFEDIQPE